MVWYPECQIIAIPVEVSGLSTIFILSIILDFDNFAANQKISEALILAANHKISKALPLWMPVILSS